jgi:hypothetical protein
MGRRAVPQQRGLLPAEEAAEQTLRNWVRQGELDDGRRTDG